MGRILAIDYGSKRTGLAVTDPLQIIANGLATVQTHLLWSYLEDYLKKEDVSEVVIGMPVRVDGSASDNQKNVLPFIRRWEKEHPDIPIHPVDERFTSVLAHRAMLDAGLKKKARRNKALVDEISATIILQTYQATPHSMPVSDWRHYSMPLGAP